MVSVKSGHVFERSLIEKYLKEYGKCPITGELLTQDDLVPVKSGKSLKPRHAPSTSIPGLIGLFQNVRPPLNLETRKMLYCRSYAMSQSVLCDISLPPRAVRRQACASLPHVRVQIDWR